MALHFLFSSYALVFFAALLSILVVSHQDLILDPAEQESIYSVLESINPTIQWRTNYPNDNGFCYSPPHGVVCDIFNETEVHITELSFGYVSDFTPNTPCTSKSTLSPLVFTSFKYLRKLFFYKCFTGMQVPVPGIGPGFGSGLEELVFVDNPGLVSPLSGILGNFTALRRVVLTGNGFYGQVPKWVGELVDVEELTLSRNNLSGNVNVGFGKLRKLKVLDFSHNFFDGFVPESVGDLSFLLKLDLSFNGFCGKIPESLKHVKSLEFLDLSFNKFGNFGVPLFLAEMPRLKEIYLSGNLLGGTIPDVWRSLRGVLAIGFSRMELVGNIPRSMGVHLRNLHYLGLDNNMLEGAVPKEFELLESVNEINLENNNLSGRFPFSANVVGRICMKLRLGGNSQLCVDRNLSSVAKLSGTLGKVKTCNKPEIPNAVLLTKGSSSTLVVQDSLVLIVFGFCLFLLCLV